MKLYCECRFAPCSQTDRLAVRHAAQTLDEGGRLIRESFSPYAFITGQRRVPINLAHDSDADIGEVTLVMADKEWWIADFAVFMHDDDAQLPNVRERVHVGAKVSPGYRSLRRDKDDDLGIIRHNLAMLEEITIIAPGEIPGYVGATITSVREAKPPKPRKTPPVHAGWRTSLPPGWENIAKQKERPVELIDDEAGLVYRWRENRYVAVG